MLYPKTVLLGYSQRKEEKRPNLLANFLGVESLPAGWKILSPQKSKISNPERFPLSGNFYPRKVPELISVLARIWIFLYPYLFLEFLNKFWANLTLIQDDDILKV